MGFLDELKEKAGDLGEKAREGLEAAKEKASGLVDDVRERFDSGDTPAGGQASDTAAPRGAGDLIGDETYFGPSEANAPHTSVDDLGAAAAGAAETTEAADTMTPVDVGAAMSSADLGDIDSAVAPGEAPSVGDVAESPRFGADDDLASPPDADLAPVGDLGSAGPETLAAESFSPPDVPVEEVWPAEVVPADGGDDLGAQTSTTFSDATTGLGEEPPAAPDQP